MINEEDKDWAGALRSYRQQYTSLELQRQALTWRRPTILMEQRLVDKKHLTEQETGDD